MAPTTTAVIDRIKCCNTDDRHGSVLKSRTVAVEAL